MTLEQTLRNMLEKNFQCEEAQVSYDGTDGGHGPNSDAQAYYFSATAEGHTEEVKVVLHDGQVIIEGREEGAEDWKHIDSVNYDELDV